MSFLFLKCSGLVHSNHLESLFQAATGDMRSGVFRVPAVIRMRICEFASVRQVCQCISGALVAGGIVGELQRVKVFIPSPVIFPHKLVLKVRFVRSTVAVRCPHRYRVMFNVELPEKFGQLGGLQLGTIVGDDLIGASVPVNYFFCNGPCDGRDGGASEWLQLNPFAEAVRNVYCIDKCAHMRETERNYDCESSHQSE